MLSQRVYISHLRVEWQLSLLAANKSHRTVEGYLYGVGVVLDWLDGREPTREVLTQFFIDRLKTHKPAGVWTIHRSAKLFFDWLVAEGHLTESPMARIKAPIIPDDPPPVIDDAALRRLLATCSRRTFEDLRDKAILRLLIDTGMRRAELVGLTVADIDLEARTATVLGKYRRPRVVPFSDKSAMALRRYVTARTAHKHANHVHLWLGLWGPMTGNGVAQMVRKRGKQAGVKVYAHQLRHTAAHRWLAADGRESDLMVLMGWRSPQMLARYGASAASERARQAYWRLGNSV